jgi:hypothetical protein
MFPNASAKFAKAELRSCTFFSKNACWVVVALEDMMGLNMFI